MMERFREKTGVMAELKDRLPQWRTTQTRIRRLTGRISERFLENGGESRTCIVQIVRYFPFPTPFHVIVLLS